LIPFHLSIDLTIPRFLCLTLPPPPRSPLFPYTTLFRSPSVRFGAPHISLRLSNRCWRRSPSPRRDGHRAIPRRAARVQAGATTRDRKSTRLNSSHLVISYAVFCLKKKKIIKSI